jgi:hypothetical protein
MFLSVLEHHASSNTENVACGYARLYCLFSQFLYQFWVCSLGLYCSMNWRNSQPEIRAYFYCLYVCMYVCMYVCVFFICLLLVPLLAVILHAFFHIHNYCTMLMLTTILHLKLVWIVQYSCRFCQKKVCLQI